jgi:hypothetical protein
MKREYERIAETFFEELSERAGPYEAKRVFLAIAKRVPRQPKGAHNSERDQKLLNLYNSLPPGNRTVKGLARKLHNKEPGFYGATEDAVDKRLRRLIKKQKDFEEFGRKLEDALGCTADDLLARLEKEKADDERRKVDDLLASFKRQEAVRELEDDTLDSIKDDLLDSKINDILDSSKRQEAVRELEDDTLDSKIDEPLDSNMDDLIAWLRDR